MIICLRPAIVNISYNFLSIENSKKGRRIIFTCVGDHNQQLDFETGESFVDAGKISHETMTCCLDVFSKKGFDINPQNIQEWNNIRYYPAYEDKETGQIERSFLAASFSLDDADFDELFKLSYKDRLPTSITLELDNIYQDNEFNKIIGFSGWGWRNKIWRNQTYENKPLAIKAMKLYFKFEDEFQNIDDQIRNE